MMDKEIQIEEMNKFLKGVHMGGSTFKDYSEKAESAELKQELVNVLESFKRHEEAITHRIEQMGGDPVDTVGIMGMMGEFFEKMKLMMADSDEDIKDRAIKAMEMGIQNGNKFIDENQNLDKSLMDEVKGVVKDYDNHLRKIESLKL